MTKKDLVPFLPLIPIGGGLLAAALSGKAIIGIIVFAATFPGVIYHLYPIYRTYVAHNPQGYWFKRKLYGWGWTPVTWQGWLTLLFYVGAVMGIVVTIDRTSHSISDTLLNTFIPLVVLTGVFIAILVKKGQSPRWQWGEEIE